MTGFGERLAAASAAHGPLCVGVDPHPGLLAAWGLPDDAEGLRRFAGLVAEAVVGHVAALKPQAAFFERHGAAGVRVLEDLLRDVTGSSSTQVVLDAKRGDVGSTMAGYADAYLRADAPFACDALTVSPYLGVGALGPAVDAALASGRGLFVLALTSNPEGREVQHARLGDVPVARRVAEHAADVNARARAAGERLGPVGLVVGATVGGAVADLGVDLAAVGGPLLAPGVGAQGAGPDDLARVFGPARRQVLASTSRAVLAAGPEVAALRDAARRAADDVAAALA